MVHTPGHDKTKTHVREPSGHATHGEEDGEVVGWEADGLVDEPRVEVDVGIQLPAHEVDIGAA